MPPKADLTLLNARLLTLEPGQSSASAVAIKDDRIVAVGQRDDVAPFTGQHTRVVDCQGMTLAPGFHDAHCHLLALASSPISLDCGPRKATSIAGIKELIRQEAWNTAPGRWIRAFGYDEDLLVEKRHPSCRDLDEAAPFNPVRLEHRTGHAVVLNSQAMTLLEITKDTADPPDGVIVREEEATGQPTGLFLEMTSHIQHLMAPYRRDDEFIEGVTRANDLLLSRGITSIQDAGADNGPERWETFLRLKEQEYLTPRVTMMVGYRRIHDMNPHGPQPPCHSESLRTGATKILLTLTTGSLRPSLEELREITVDLHRRGLQLAFHAVETEAIQAAAQAISEAQRAFPRRDARHRIEHCSEGLPEVLRQVKSSGATVVTQPGFIYHNGAKYLSQVDGLILPHLYPLGALVKANIPWAAGSDAPVAPIDPLMDIYAAVTRKTAEGRLLGGNQAVDVQEALRAWTLGGAYACFQEDALGSIKVGKLADLVLLDRDPTQIDPEELKDLKVIMTVVGGKVAWEA